MYLSINLVKGQKIDLTKGNPGLQKLLIGLGWDPVKKKGLFGSFKQDLDADASVLLLDENDTLTEIVYYGKLTSKDKSVQHSGDNLTGSGKGDDEQIQVDLKAVSPRINKLVFVVNIYQAHNRKQDFGMVTNAFIRVENSSNGEELARFNLTDDYSGKTALIVGEIYRYGNEWKFAAIGEGTKDGSLDELSRRYR